MMKRIKIIAIAVIAVLTLIVVLQNTESIQTQILFWNLTMPKALLLFGAVLVGFALGVLTVGRMSRRRRG
jgi:uncharacterized integral membrane protein